MLWGALMSFYAKELAALKRSGRYRERHINRAVLKDFASNDYLGLADTKELHEATCRELSLESTHAAKASMLVNGYHPIHKNFEEALAAANGFEEAVVLGSGFNANIALIEALVRKGDKLFMDELYHASGVLASQLHGMDVTFFKHNDMEELETLLKNSSAKRNIVAVEGIYSMEGDLCAKEIFSIADRYEAILIVDEAHSSGVVGRRLMGVYEYYDIEVAPNHIKMGTLGKAYGSFGAYILASQHIIDYLINRAKPIIYATALSLYDTLLAQNALNYILNNYEQLHKDIIRRKKIVYDTLGINIAGLIVPICVGDNRRVIEIKEELLLQGYEVGAIRQPTVPSAIIRLIARLGESDADLLHICKVLAKIV
jgi:8-amino-7-oxononanoate synthase